MQLCIFEDTQYKNFHPLVYFRPVYDLRCGALSLREKIASFFPRAVFVFHVRKELESYYREEHPNFCINEIPKEDTWFVNGRVLADEEFSRVIRKHDRNREIVYRQGGDVVAAFVKGATLGHLERRMDMPLSAESFESLPAEELPLRMVRHLWDLIHRSAEEIENDFHRLAGSRDRRPSARTIYPGSHLLQKKEIRIGEGTLVKPGVVLDAEEGPIIIGKGVMLMPNAVVEGPAFIGDRSTIKVGAKIYHGTSIGEQCKVGGEVESSIIQSYANKQHDGFLGHSYLGSWVNIGADTNTSDLKNTYGSVNVQIDSERIDTGSQFVGLMMGDHSKTGINVMFDTGAIVGVSCNIFGAGLPPKFIPSFSWGEARSLREYHLEKGLETARRVFARRDCAMTEEYERLFRRVHAETQGMRTNAGVK